MSMFLKNETIKKGYIVDVDLSSLDVLASDN